MTTMNIQLQNRTNSNIVYAHITGHALDHQNHVCFIRADGKTPYYPTNPPQIGTKLSESWAINLGAQGTITTVTIPHLAGGRIWFSVDKELTFLLNPGPAIIEPSVTNPSDPKIHTEWDFCEFTFANNQLYANISYVDFVSLSISLTLTPTSGEVQKVLGLKHDGLASIAAGLQSSALPFSNDWKKCLYISEGKILRILSPNAAHCLNGQNLFQGYYDPYVNQVWDKYSYAPLTINTRAQWGGLNGQVIDGKLEFKGIGSFGKPSSQDIFSCSTGPFASNVGALGPLTARISTGFNRSTLLMNGVHPDQERVGDYYKEKVTNHYSRLVRAVILMGGAMLFRMMMFLAVELISRVL
jgi:hypothetical protein